MASCVLPDQELGLQGPARELSVSQNDFLPATFISNIGILLHAVISQHGLRSRRGAEYAVAHRGHGPATSFGSSTFFLSIFSKFGDYSQELDVEIRSWESGDGV